MSFGSWNFALKNSNRIRSTSCASGWRCYVATIGAATTPLSAVSRYLYWLRHDPTNGAAAAPLLALPRGLYCVATAFFFGVAFQLGISARLFMLSKGNSSRGMAFPIPSKINPCTLLKSTFTRTFSMVGYFDCTLLLDFGSENFVLKKIMTPAINHAMDEYKLWTKLSFRSMSFYLVVFLVVPLLRLLVEVFSTSHSSILS